MFTSGRGPVATMLSDLLRLVIRGERSEGKGVEGSDAPLQRFHLPHAKLHHHHNTLKGRSKKFCRGSSSHSALSSSSTSSSSSPFSHYRRRVEVSRSKSSKKKELREEGRGRSEARREGCSRSTADPQVPHHQVCYRLVSVYSAHYTAFWTLFLSGIFQSTS